MSKEFRTEHDSLGDFQVPDEAWYGIQTARAVANFSISGRAPDRDFIIAHAQIKSAAASANQAANWLDKKPASAIIKAAEKIISGQYHDQFVVDRFQAGAGTSHNMNTNEVIANLANVALGSKKGSYDPINPNDHVNMGQSTNDTIPTAIRIAVLAKLPRLLQAINAMADRFQVLGDREAKTVKSGRTHLQDAVPTTLGREFCAYAYILRRSAERIAETTNSLCEVGLGGSAVGTGLNTCPDYAPNAAKVLSELTGNSIRISPDLAASMQSMTDLQHLSNAIRACALELTRISNDMRLMASGPRTGLAEIMLTPVQPGSSIMPGKVNPVMFEMLNQVCYQVLGQDSAISFMVQAGQLELNVMMPALGSALFDSMDWLTNAVNAVTEKNLEDVMVDRDRCKEFAHSSVGLATLLNTRIGYNEAAKVAKESQESGRPVRELVSEKGLLTVEEFDQLVELAAVHGNIPKQ